MLGRNKSIKFHKLFTFYLSSPKPIRPVSPARFAARRSGRSYGMLVSLGLIVFTLFLSPTLSYANLTGTTYEIEDELFDNGGGVRTGGTYKLSNSSLGQWVQGKFSGIQYDDLTWHCYKDVTEPVCSGMDFWLPDPNNIYKVRLSWGATDEDYSEFDSGMGGYDVDYRIEDWAPNVWAHISPENPGSDPNTQYDPSTQTNDSNDLIIAPADITKRFYFRVFALDNVGNVNTLCGIDDVNFGQLWFQGIDGTVHAENNLICEISSFADNGYIVYDTTGVPGTRGGIPSSGGILDSKYGDFSSRGAPPGWNVDASYQTNLDHINYDWFYDNLNGQEATIVPDGGNGVVNASELIAAINGSAANANLFLVEGDLNVDGDISAIQNRNLVILVNGDVTFSVNPNIHSSTTMAIIVQGDVEVNNAVIQIDALIFADGTISTSSNPSNADQLNINGGLISRELLSLSRRRDITIEENLRNPTEKATLDPEAYFKLGLSEEVLGIPRVTWKEVTE